MAEGLRFVYLGNVPGHPGENTYCPGCGKLLVRRFGMAIAENRHARTAPAPTAAGASRASGPEVVYHLRTAASANAMLPEKFGRYEVIDELGDGAMGRVYRAWDPAVNRVVAVKTMQVRVPDPRHGRRVPRGSAARRSPRAGSTTPPSCASSTSATTSS